MKKTPGNPVRDTQATKFTKRTLVFILHLVFLFFAADQIKGQTSYFSIQRTATSDKILIDNNILTSIPDFSISGPPQYYLIPSGCSQIPFGISFTNSIGKISNNRVACGAGIFLSIVDKNPHEGINVTDTFEEISCNELRDHGESLVHSFEYQMAYDTLKYYIEHCATMPNAWTEFSEITVSAIGLGDAKNYVWKPYKNWLGEVLNLNNEQHYFCSDIFEVARIFEFFCDTSNTQPDFNAVVSIAKYVIDSLPCPFFLSNFNDLISQARHLQHLQWQDTVKDSVRTPLDTTLKTIDKLGLGFLRQYTSGVSTTSPKTRNSISTLTAIKNPFDEEEELVYTLNTGEAIRVEICDILGKTIWSEGQGYHDRGSSSLKISTKNWSPGTYYARLVTSANETKTIVLKLVR